MNEVRWTNHESVVGPASELHGAVLIVEREPGDIDLTRALEDPWRDQFAAAVVAHYDVRLVRVVETLVGTEKHQQKSHKIRKKKIEKKLIEPINYTLLLLLLTTTTYYYYLLLLITTTTAYYHYLLL